MSYVRFEGGRAVEIAVGWNPGAGWVSVDPALEAVWEKLQIVNGATVVVEPAEADVLAEALARARENARARVLIFAAGMRERISKSTHYLHSARWPVQLASAQAVKLGTPTAFDTSTLGREARLRGLGETVEQLADKVVANSLVFASVGAAIDGIERATLDRVAACTLAAGFEPILADAKGIALAEFLDIFTGVYGAEQAAAMAEQFFGPGS